MDLIERVFGVWPDGGDGSLELIVIVAVVIAVARRTRSGEISSYAGLFQTSPGLAVVMTFFLASLAGIPPLAGWFAKFVMFRSIIEAGTGWGIALAVIAAVNSVISVVSV